MTNHIHLIAGVKYDEKNSVPLAGSMVVPGVSKSLNNRGHLAPRETMEPAVGSELMAQGLDGIIRDFKRHTTKEIKRLLRKDNRKYILRLIDNSFKLKKGSQFQIWQRENYPKIIVSNDFCDTKIQYIWDNPVKKQYVLNPEDWVYSSARQKLLDLSDDHVEVVLPCK